VILDERAGGGQWGRRGPAGQGVLGTLQPYQPWQSAALKQPAICTAHHANSCWWGPIRHTAGGSLELLSSEWQTAYALSACLPAWLPVCCRVLKLLERAPRSIRLVSDKEPVQVVYEDNAFLAICKPPGLRSAPVHRFMGGSAVNRIIGYLGAEPHLLHRWALDGGASHALRAGWDRAYFSRGLGAG